MIRAGGIPGSPAALDARMMSRHSALQSPSDILKYQVFMAHDYYRENVDMGRGGREDQESKQEAVNDRPSSGEAERHASSPAFDPDAQARAQTIFARSRAPGLNPVQFGAQQPVIDVTGTERAFPTPPRSLGTGGVTRSLEL